MNDVIEKIKEILIGGLLLISVFFNYLSTNFQYISWTVVITALIVIFNYPVIKSLF